MLVLVDTAPGGSSWEHEPVTDYLNSVDDERARTIGGRLSLLELLGEDDRLPDPPFEPVPGEDELTQLLVDFDGEVHRVVFGARSDMWVLVHAFLDEGAASRATELAVAIARWRLPQLP